MNGIARTTSDFRGTIAVAGLVVGVAIASASAQTSPPPQAASEQRQWRYQTSVMERVLENAVEHGATVTRDRLQAILPDAMLLAENAAVRGFRLEGYGVFFDVAVPSLQGTLPWSFRTLDRNDLGLDSALKALRSHVEAAGDLNLQQALKRIELQVGPLAPRAQAATTPARAGTRTAVGALAAAPAVAEEPAKEDPILADPEEAYRSEVKQALMDAMLDYSGPLGIGAEEWLTVAARRNDDRPRLASPDSEVRTIVIRVRGSDLTAFRAARLSREEALKRMDVRVF